jgi:uncharacterized membrane protein YphA (DoxX/SURF4 family)
MVHDIFKWGVTAQAQERAARAGIENARTAYLPRTDFAMLLGSLFLLIVGAGEWSMDARLRMRN